MDKSINGSLVHVEHRALVEGLNRSVGVTAQVHLFCICFEVAEGGWSGDSVENNNTLVDCINREL